MKTYIIPFSIKHVLLMSLREHEQHCMSANEEYLDNIMSMARLGDAVTVVTDAGDIVACLGAYPYWPGMIEMWAVTGELCDKYPIAFDRAALDYIETVERIYEPHRIQANVDAGYSANMKWMEHLGFESEGLMRKFSVDGRDYVRYAKIKESA
jgi:hypothetical protein